jgi:hypothetical protein
MRFQQGCAPSKEAQMLLGILIVSAVLLSPFLGIFIIAMKV